jgi:Uma2 family endonuclease
MEALTLNLDSILEITDEQFFKICQKNRELRFELSALKCASRDITIMAHAGSDAGMRNSDINADLGRSSDLEPPPKVGDYI